MAGQVPRVASDDLLRLWWGLAMKPETMAAFMRELCAEVEQAAYRGTRRALGEVAQSDELDSEGAAKVLGKVREDGSGNVSALKSFMQRHAVPHRKVGTRLLFSRRELQGWIEDRPPAVRRHMTPRERREQGGRDA